MEPEGQTQVNPDGLPTDPSSPEPSRDERPDGKIPPKVETPADSKPAPAPTAPK